MGDALAVALLESRGFTAEDFARSHPGGTLGRRLLLRVEDLMHTDELIPRVGHDTPLATGLLEMSQKGLGMTAVVTPDGRLQGVFTDGDLRRALDRNLDVHKTMMRDVMTRDCITVRADQLAAEAVRIMEDNKIMALLVTDDEQRVIGALNVHDFFRAGVM
jgi:arabinose-5-phosphate isomerase